MLPVDASLQAYWKQTLRLTVVLLVIWALAGFVLPLVLGPWLNRFTFLGGPLGFWMAQNGAIYIFWLLVLAYAVGMNRIDERFGVGEA